MINATLSIPQLFTTILLYHNQAHCHLHSLQISHVECNDDDDDDHVHVYVWYIMKYPLVNYSLIISGFWYNSSQSINITRDSCLVGCLSKFYLILECSLHPVVLLLHPVVLLLDLR